MKTTSLKSIIILTALIAIQAGCNLSNHKTDLKTEYEQAKQFEKQGNFMVHEGEIDSAINYFNASHKLFKDILSRADSTKDTLYIKGIVLLDQYTALAYDTIHNSKSQDYFFESLKWANIGHFTHERLYDEEMIGFKYIDSVDEKDMTSDASKRLLTKSKKYLQAACWDLDSLGMNRSKRALNDYYLLMNIYEVLGDSTRQKFYKEKYYNLKDELNGIERVKVQ